jgi:hypothetical protein
MTPTIRSFTSGGGDNPTTVSVSKPSGLTAGDLMLGLQVADADAVMANMTAPSGFVNIGQQTPTAGVNIPAFKVWRKVADAADVSASTFAFPDGGDSHCSVVLLTVTIGTFNTTDFTSTPAFSTQGDASASSMDAPSITGQAGALLLCVFGPDTGGTVRTFSSGPSGMTLVAQSAAGSATYTRLGVYSQVLASGGATGTKTAGLSGTPDGWTAGSMLVLPPSGAEPGRGMFLGA